MVYDRNFAFQKFLQAINYYFYCLIVKLTLGIEKLMWSNPLFDWVTCQRDNFFAVVSD